MQLDTTTIEEKLNRMALGQGAVEYFESQGLDKDGNKKDKDGETITEDDEINIVENYKRVDANMAEVGAALREGRRIRYKPDDGKKTKKKKSKLGMASPLFLSRSTDSLDSLSLCLPR